MVNASSQSQIFSELYKYVRAHSGEFQLGNVEKAKYSHPRPFYLFLGNEKAQEVDYRRKQSCGQQQLPVDDYLPWQQAWPPTGQEQN